MSNSLQDIYNSAASVQTQTGVDPGIIAALAKTEGPTGANAALISMGIQTAATSGRGTSGATLGAGSPGPGQPSRFWAYDNGAEAAQAFASYIRQQFPNQAQYLGNASQFFQSMETTNYNVIYNNPSVGQSSGINWAATKAYWVGKINDAAAYAAGDFGGAVSSGAQLVSGQSSSDTSTSSSSGSQFTLVPGASGPGFDWPGIKISTGFLWSAGFFVLAGLLIVVGLLIAFRKQVEQGLVTAGKAAGV